MITITVISEAVGPIFPSSVISRCPAIIFAANRTERVIGRMILLIISIHTINDIRAIGVPWGTKCANICIVWLIQPYSIKDSQRGRAKVRVKIKCLEAVKINGNKPKEFLIKMVKKIEIGIRVILLIFVGPSRVLNSLWRVRIIFWKIIEIRVGISQYNVGNNRIDENSEIQLSWIGKDLEGSKIENKLVIIIN